MNPVNPNKPTITITKMKTISSIAVLLLLGATLSTFGLFAQDENDAPESEPRPGSGSGAPGDGGPRGGNVMTMMPVLVALDADKDGTISAEELENATAALKTLDKNGDGSLTEDEVRPNFGGGSRGQGGPGGTGGDTNTKGKGDPESGGKGGAGSKGAKGSKGGKDKGGKGSDSSTGEVVPKRPPVDGDE